MALAVAMTGVAAPLASQTPAVAAAVTCTPIGYTDCVRYTYTGADQTFTVPAGITSITADVWGAGGANSLEGSGGGGGWTTGSISVTPGQVLTITVGEGGKENSAVGTYGGGGRGGIAGTGPVETGSDDGGSGGGMSAIWLTSYGVGPLLIAGGGGAASFETANDGAGGGGSTGGNNADASAGDGGTQSAGGSAGHSGCELGHDGVAYHGGAGGDEYVPGGGGGGGYYGGGGGDCRTFAGVNFAGAGGGGSGYKNGAGVSGAYTYASTNDKSAADGAPLHLAGIGDAEGNGQVAIQWITPPTASPLSSIGAFEAAQSVTVAVPVSGAVRLLNAGNLEVTTVTFAGQGTYTLNTGTGVITFTPVSGFSGTPNPVTYRVRIGELNASSTYTPTVTPGTPHPPTPSALTSTGIGTAAQSATATVPAGTTITLLGTSGQPTSTVTVDQQGTYSLNPASGVITFTPVAGFQGTATAVGYRLTNAANLTGDSTYTPSVTKPAGPSPVTKTSNGLGTATQTAGVDLPAGATVGFLSGGSPTASLTVSGQGTYAWNGADKVLTFTPLAGFVGVATAATYRVTDSYGQHGDATYTATVRIPPPPDPPDRTTSGEGVTPQTATLPVPANGTIALIDANGNPTTSLFIPQKGTYTLQLVAATSTAAIPGAVPAGAASVAAVPTAAGGTVPNPSQQAGTATVIFTPVLGFSGPLPPVDYQVTDAYGQSATARYTPLVTIPGPPAPPSQTTSGPPDKTQTATLTVPAGGSITLLDARGRPAILVRVAGQGTYVLQPATGHISFVAVPGFSGQATKVRYRVTDAYGQVAESTYSAYVSGTALAVTGLGLLDLILVGATMIPTGATLVVLGRPTYRIRRRVRIA